MEMGLREESVVDLIKGSIRAFTKGFGGQAAFDVRVGTSVCGIRGTDIKIDYLPELDEATFELYQGVVEITTPGGKVILEPGETLTVREGVPVRRAAPPA
jgi:hypothetical protein